MAANFRLGRSSQANRAGVDPRLIEISDRAIAISLVDFGIPANGGLRTAEIQHQLYKDKLSSCDGYNNKSLHQTGLALDFFAYVNNGASWEHAHLAMVAAAFLQAASELGYHVEWGGLWRSKKPRLINGIAYGWDCPHIQLME